MIFDWSLRPNGEKTRFFRNIELQDAIYQLELHLLTAITANANDNFIAGIERSISILKDLNKPLDLDGDVE